MIKLLIALIFWAPALATEKPNILLILADDLGYNEMGFMNASRGIITPHLDSLAHDGIILKQYYVQPICSPMRGCTFTHWGLQGGHPARPLGLAIA